MRADLWEVDTNLKVVQAPAAQDETFKGTLLIDIRGFFYFESIIILFLAKVSEKLAAFKQKKLAIIAKKTLKNVKQVFSL